MSFLETVEISYLYSNDHLQVLLDLAQYSIPALKIKCSMGKESDDKLTVEQGMILVRREGKDALVFLIRNLECDLTDSSTVSFERKTVMCSVAKPSRIKFDFIRIIEHKESAMTEAEMNENIGSEEYCILFKPGDIKQMKVFNIAFLSILTKASKAQIEISFKYNKVYEDKRMGIIKHLPISSQIHVKVMEKYMDCRNSVNALSGQFFKLDAIYTTEFILKTLSVKNLVSICCDQFMSEEQTKVYMSIIEMCTNLNKVDLTFANESLMLKMFKVLEKLKNLCIIKLKYQTNCKSTHEVKCRIKNFIKRNYSKAIFINEIQNYTTNGLKSLNNELKVEPKIKKYYSAYYL